MFVSLRPVTAADVSVFVRWRYEAPYDGYDLRLPLDEAIEEFLAPETNCHIVLTSDGLAGYCTFGEDARVPGGAYDTPALDIGAALKPELTGRGYGIEFVAAIFDFASRTFNPAIFRVSIATANTRAITVWAANGFVETQRFHTQKETLGTTEFAIFERDSEA